MVVRLDSAWAEMTGIPMVASSASSMAVQWDILKELTLAAL